MMDRRLPDIRVPFARNGSVVGMVRLLVSFAAAVAAVVIFAWASQARQDEAIRRNEKAIAVLGTRLDAICEKLDEIRTLLSEERVPHRSTSLEPPESVERDRR